MLPRLVALLILFHGVLPCLAANCRGGSLAACSCLLQCEVFGGEAWRCEQEEDAVAEADAAVQSALKQRNPKTECDAMGCVVSCAKRLGCLGETVRRRCERNQIENADCDVDCNAAPRAAAPPSVFNVFLAIMAMVLATKDGV